MHKPAAQSQASFHSHRHAGRRAPAETPAALAGGPKLYNPRHPERTPLYRTIAEHFETWLELASAGQFDGQGDHHTPRTYVRQAFRKYLACGIFAHGFARARCDDCGHDYFVAYSCKGRGVCPSCNTRRMAETAAHLTDHVFPRRRHGSETGPRVRCLSGLELKNFYPSNPADARVVQPEGRSDFGLCVITAGGGRTYRCVSIASNTGLGGIPLPTATLEVSINSGNKFAGGY